MALNFKRCLQILLLTFPFSSAIANSEGNDSPPYFDKSRFNEMMCGVNFKNRVRSAIENPSLRNRDLKKLVTELRDEDPEKRAIAALGIGMFGKKATSAIPDLEMLISDPNADVRECAVEALNQIGKISPRTKMKIADAAGDSEICVALAALHTIRHQETNDVFLKPKILPLLSSGIPQIRGAAADVLGWSFTMDKSYRPALERLLEDPSPEVQARAVIALFNFKLVSDLAIRKFISLCGSGNRQVTEILEKAEFVFKSVRFSPAEADQLFRLREKAKVEAGPEGKDFYLIALLDLLDLKGHDLAVDKIFNIWWSAWDIGTDILIPGTNNIEMFEDGHKEYAIVADSAYLVGRIFKSKRKTL